ncbi:MAG: hypothetical protein R2748_25890 [Bryobacterales bacterium]
MTLTFGACTTKPVTVSMSDGQEPAWFVWWTTVLEKDLEIAEDRPRTISRSRRQSRMRTLGWTKGDGLAGRTDSPASEGSSGGRAVNALEQ